MKHKIKYVENSYRVAIKQCCASCAHKDLTRLMLSRYCSKRKKKVNPSDVCSKWTMSEQLQMAGSGKGRVKCMEYLNYALSNSLLDSPQHKSIEQIRAEFEQKVGPVFINI